ncbi:MAG: helix-turn-helix transcriptional regulator [Caldilineaceae bacterium]|nr:helix-turn-helix transcriptional regulator [Caldilineaceae bacterium]
MLNYTFAELLTVYFHLHQDLETRKTQAELATAIGVSRRTLAGWFAGDYLPRTAELIERLATALSLTAFQADLLLYAVNPGWVKYGTPATVLAQAEVIRYREQDEKPQPFPQAMPSIAQIEATWRPHFIDAFTSNYQRWGVGYKNNGICRLERAMLDGRYQLTVQNDYHEDVFMGGDSNCFAPPLYYLTVQAQMTKGGTDADGYGLLFEAINDECYAFFRVRERMRRISVVQTRNDGDNATVYLRQLPAPALQPGAWNKLAILAIHNEHWFYVNDKLVGHQVLPRLPVARLDVGIAAGAGQAVVCEYRRFRVTVP